METAPRQPSRREFLKTTAAAGATAYGLSLARGAHAAGNQSVKVGMIGCGGRCSGAGAQALRVGKDVKLAAMTDVFENRMRAKQKYFQSKYPDQFVAKDDACVFGLDGYKRVIEESDAVLIACASKFHSYYAEHAIKAGKHVFMEKPCCTDAPGYRELVKANEMADEQNLKVVVGLQRHHDARYVETVSAKGDPGYQATCVMLGEAA